MEFCLKVLIASRERAVFQMRNSLKKPKNLFSPVVLEPIEVFRAGEVEKVIVLDITVSVLREEEL